MKTQQVVKVIGEGGAHSHKLASSDTTQQDGYHKHLFFVGNRLLMSDLGGEHSHSIDVQNNAIGKQLFPHSHDITVKTPDGLVTFSTDSGGDHSHELQTGGTTVSGVHKHILEIGEGRFPSMVPGDLIQAVEAEARKTKALSNFKIKKSDNPMEMNYPLIKRLNKSDLNVILVKAVAQVVIKSFATLDEGLQVESLILSKDRYKDIGEATQFVLDSSLAINGVVERDDAYIFKIRAKDKFEESTLQRITLSDGVVAVIGILKDDEGEVEDSTVLSTIDTLSDKNKRASMKSRLNSLLDSEEVTVTKAVEQKFIDFKTNKLISGTTQEIVSNIAKLHGITKKFVTIEPAFRRSVVYITTEFEMVSAVHQDLSYKVKENDNWDIEYKNFHAKTDKLEAFLTDMNRYGSDLIIFFDDPNDLDEIFKNDIKNYKLGAYEYRHTMQGPVLVPMEVDKNAILILDEKIIENLKSDTENFFSAETEKFFYDHKHMGLIYKRGIFLYGPPGNGKTTMIKYFVTNFLKEAYTIYCEPSQFDGGMGDFLKQCLGVEAKKTIVFEDIDAIMNSYSARSELLNFIDGPKVMDKTLFIATTNYPGRLDEALTKRPSRFDQKYFIDLPNFEMRKKFLAFYFKDISESELDSAAEATNEFSGAYFKELFILKNLRKIPIAEAINILRSQMIEVYKSVTVDANLIKGMLFDGADKDIVKNRFLDYKNLSKSIKEKGSLQERFANLLDDSDKETEDDENSTIKNPQICLKFEILKTNAKKRLVYGPVLIPENNDLQDEIISAEEIEKAAHNYMIKLNFRDDEEFLKQLGLNNKSKRGLMHVEFNRKIAIVENYMAPVDFVYAGRSIVKDTWIMAVKVFDDEVWALVEAGKITGFSIGGRSQAIALD